MFGFLPSIDDREEQVPLLSGVLVGAAIVVSDFNYDLIHEGSVLLFYAVVVQIGTSSGGGLTREGYFEFLMSSAGAVTVGYLVELALQTISNGMLAVQALALAILLSRLYVNSMHGKMIRWHDPIDRCVVYIPCIVAILLPIVLSQVEIYPIFGFDPNSLSISSQDSFLGNVWLSLMVGLLSYGRTEGWGI